MANEIYSKIYSAPKLVFTEKIERNLKFYLRDKIENVHKLGEEVECTVSEENLYEVLKELKGNPEFQLESLCNIALFESRGRNFLLIILSSHINNFSILVKVKLNGQISESRYNGIVNLAGEFYEASDFYKKRDDLKSRFSDIVIFSQNFDGLDGFDIYALSADDLLNKIYIDRSISKFDTSSFYRNSDILKLISYIGRFDYKAAIFPELCFCINFEKLLQLKIPKRAQHIRMLVCELFRISNHTGFIVNMSWILGCSAAYNLALIEKERILRLIEHVTDSRIFPNFIRIGGVVKDIEEGEISNIKKDMEILSKNIKVIEGMILGSSQTVEKLKNKGIIDKSAAVSFGLSGPNLRASGVRSDLRKERDILFYRDISFIVPLGKYGDCLDRVLIRFRELYQSIKIINQTINKMPMGVVRKMINVSHIELPFSTMISSVECPHGVFKVYIEVEKNEVISLVVAGPSKNSLAVCEKILNKSKIDDASLILASLDISTGEIMG